MRWLGRVVSDRWLVIFLLLAALMTGLIQYLSRVSYVEPVAEELNEIQAEELETYREMNRLLTSLSTLVFGAVGSLLLGVYRDAHPPKVIRRAALLTCIFAGISIYFGLLSYQGVLWMFHSSFFNLYNPIIERPLKLQFFTFLAAIFFLGRFFFSTIDQRGDEQ